MRIALTLLSAAAALTLAACNSPADKAAENQADALEAQAAATSNEAAETALNAKADAIEQQAGNADGGATTENTPNTSPSAPH
jgi:phage-related tail protein